MAAKIQKKCEMWIKHEAFFVTLQENYGIMTKTIKSLFPMLLLAAGLFVWSGCSKDDDEPTDQPVYNIPNSPLTEAVGTVNEQMAGLDFHELTSLTDAVSATTRAGDNSVRSEFETKLSTLLSLLQTDQATTRSITLGHRFSFNAFNNVLQLAWDLSVILGDEGESSSSWFGLNSTKKGEVNYTAKDGSLYTVKGLIDKEVTIQFRGFNTKLLVKKASEFFIYKDGEQMLKILSGREDNRPIWLPILIKDLFYTGQFYYRDYEINLSYDKNSTHSRTIDLTYSKIDEDAPILTMSAKLEDDADILKIIKHDVNVRADFMVEAKDGKIVFEGTTNNVNYLVVYGVRISKCMKEGTTKEECEQLVESFNNNLTLNLTVADISVGQIYMGTLYDANTQRYYPTVMIHTTLLGDEDFPLNTVLDILGVDIPDILKTAAEINA